MDGGRDFEKLLDESAKVHGHLCVEFCRHDALKLRGGHEGSGLMEFVSVRAIPSVNVEQGNGHNSPIRVA